MPIYEFVCKNCSHSFEGLYSVGTKAETLDCPECKQKSLKKIFSPFAVSSKGGPEKEFSGINTASSGSKCGSCSSKSCSTCG